MLYTFSNDYKDVYVDCYTLCGKNSLSLFRRYRIQSIMSVAKLKCITSFKYFPHLN